MWSKKNTKAMIERRQMWCRRSFWVGLVLAAGVATASQPEMSNLKSGMGMPAGPNSPAAASGYGKSKAIAKPQATQAQAGSPQCSGTFSDGTSVNPTAPVLLTDVPGDQLFCDFHTFAWNQFIYLTQMQPDPNNGNTVTPLFLHMAPWYNLLLKNGSPPPTVYPGGSTALQTAGLDQGQAGDDDHLVDVTGATVLYDIRFNDVMYNGIVANGTYTESGFAAACKPATDKGAKTQPCANPLWLPPTSTSTTPTMGSMEIKSSWRNFGTAADCPTAQFYCNGQFGLVGLHLVQKTQTHGEWIWASFEHIANDPDCFPSGDTPIAAQSPLGSAWSFFNPSTAGSGVMTSQICEVTGTAPQCNANPKVSGGTTPKYQAVNICRTDILPPGGANSVNCNAVQDGPPQQFSNSAGNVACLNATFQPKMQNVWQNYKMIGSLWIRGETGPTQDFRIQIFQQPETQTKKQSKTSPVPYGQPVGFPNMANTTMETWMQSGSTGYDPAGTNASQAGCFLCHNLPSGLGEFSSDDLSHYPGKLPQNKQAALRKALVPAAVPAMVK